MIMRRRNVLNDRDRGRKVAAVLNICFAHLSHPSGYLPHAIPPTSPGAFRNQVSSPATQEPAQPRAKIAMNKNEEQHKTKQSRIMSAAVDPIIPHRKILRKL